MGRWAKAHGNAAEGGETLVFEHGHSDHAAKAKPGMAIEIKRDGGGKVRSREAASALAKLRKHVPNFVTKDIRCTEDFAPFNRQRRNLTRQRIAELYQQTGGASRGVGARVRSACWATSFGEYLAAKAAETGDPELMDRAVAILDKAATLDEKARRLAIDEASHRPPTAADEPWFTTEPAPPKPKPARQPASPAPTESDPES